MYLEESHRGSGKCGTQFRGWLAASLGIVLLAFSGPSCSGSTIITPAQHAAEVMARAIEASIKLNSGRVPRSFADTTLDPTSAPRFLGGDFTFGERFFWLPASDPDGPGIVVMTRDQIREDRRDSGGRYVVWVDLNAKYGPQVYVRWEPEFKAREIVERLGLKLPLAGTWVQPDVRENPWSHFAISAFEENGANETSQPSRTSLSVAWRILGVAVAVVAVVAGGRILRGRFGKMRLR